MSMSSVRARIRPGLTHAVVLSLVSATMALTASLLAAAPAQASGSPDLQLSGGPAATVLYGDTVPVDLTASLPAGAPKGYNLAFRSVLPAGTAYVAGSAGNDGEPQIITNAPTSGKTTLIWPNVDDLVASSGHTLSFQVSYNTTSSVASPKYDVGDLLPIDSGAYISTDPRDETDFNALGQAVAGVDSYTGSAELTTNTSLTAIRIRKSEPHPEGEIPRGVHDHQTVYTLTITNNHVNPTNTVSAEDFLPAGLEFLGCAGTTDHTTKAPTNLASAQEYPGSGPIVVLHPTAVEKCVVPDLVETVTVDPDGTGPLPTGVYTHVVWNNLGNFAANQVTQLSYAAAIPIRENTMTWTTAGGAPATTGAQTANLDNNSGSETYDEQPLLNGAMVAGTYQAPAKPGQPVTDEGTLLRTAEDIAIQKSNDNGGLEQGDLTKWTVDLQVSEYRFLDDVVIHDVVPNGLCPLGPTNLTHATSGSDSECAPVAGKNPSQPYTSVTEQANGTYDLTWDKSTYPGLAHLDPSATRQLTFWTRTRENYQSGFVDSTPVLSRDSVTNNIDTSGVDWVRCAPADPNCAGAGTKIDHDEADGVADYDVSGSGKAAQGPVILKRVAAHYPVSGDCNDLVAADYGKTVPEYGPGDKVCWDLRLVFPANLDTSSQDVFDILPAGIDYVAGSWQTVPGSGHNTVPVGAIDTSTSGRLRWPIGTAGWDVDAGGKVFEVTIKTTVGSPLGHHSGDVEGNLQKFSYVNTAGKAFTLRDRVDFAVKLPEIALLKGVMQVNSGTVNGPNVDDVHVLGGDSVKYRVDLTNNGRADATDARIWDVLPAGIDCGDVQVGTISNAGTCNVAQKRIEWTGIDLAVGASKTLTYKLTVPVGVSPGQSYVNRAGVVELTYVGNTGTRYQLVPANPNVTDPAMPTPNATSAEDPSRIFTAAAFVTKARTTSVTETGNAAANEATIGERVDYTVTTTIPKGTTIYGTPTVVDALGARQTLVPGSLCATPCTLDGAALPSGVTVTESPANTVRATFPATYANTTGHDVALVMTFSVTVLDVAANTRGSNLPNAATLTFKDQGNVTRTATGSTTTRVVEPKLILAKSHTPPGRVGPDQLVTFTVRVTNTADTASTYFSPAHDVVVVDSVPVGTAPVDFAGNPIADGGTVPGDGGIWNATARTITWTKATTTGLAKIDPGSNQDLTYQVRLESTPVGGQTYTNVVDATTTSLDGSVPGVRTPTSPGTTAPDYKAHATDVLSVVLPTITKDVAPDPVTIGNPVTWHVHVSVPAHVSYYDATVVDTVPDGFDIDGYGAATCVSGCPGGDPAIVTLSPASAGGGTLTTAWFLGDLAPTSSDRVYDLVIKGHLRNTYRTGGANVLTGATLTNSASIRTNRTDKVLSPPATVPGSYDDTAGPATAASHVVEPKLTITKSADKGPTVLPGEPVTYTITVKNTGTSPAHDVVVDDQPDTELTGVTLGSGAGFNTDGWTAGDPHLRWVVPGPIAVGATVTLTYSATVAAAGSVPPSAAITNVAQIVEYFGVPKADRDAAPATVYRRYTGPNDTVTLTVVPYADLEIVKTPDHSAYDGGDLVTWTLVVTNHGPSAAQHVTVDDPLPSKVVFVSVAPGSACAESSGTVHCTFASIASGASKTVTIVTRAKGQPPSTTPANSHSHQLTVAKAEQYLTLQAGETRTQELTCADNGYMSDGSAEIMHVDQGTGSPADVVVARASTQAPGTYRFTLVNTTTGQAQVKIFGTCLPHDTEVTKSHRHALDVGAPVPLDTGAMTVGRHTFTVPVSAGHRAVAPGIEVTSGVARLVGSEPVAGGWQLTVEVLQPATATLSIRELADRVALGGSPVHTHPLTFQHVVTHVSVPPGESVQRVSCPVGFKGVVATYDLPLGVVMLGHEPQPINRDFRILNTTNGNLDVMLDLECLAIDTGESVDPVVTVTNTATVASTTYDPDLSNNASTASVQVSLTAGTEDTVVFKAIDVAPRGDSARVGVRCRGAGSCAGTVRLSAKVRAHGKHHAHRVVIGSTHYRLKHGKQTKVRIPIKHRYRHLVRSGRMTGFRVR